MKKIAFTFIVPPSLHRQAKNNLSLVVIAHRLSTFNHITVDFPYLNEAELIAVTDWLEVVELAKEEAKKMFAAGQGEEALSLLKPMVAGYGSKEAFEDLQERSGGFSQRDLYNQLQEQECNERHYAFMSETHHE